MQTILRRATLSLSNKSLFTLPCLDHYLLYAFLIHWGWFSLGSRSLLCLMCNFVYMSLLMHIDFYIPHSYKFPIYLRFFAKMCVMYYAVTHQADEDPQAYQQHCVSVILRKPNLLVHKGNTSSRISCERYYLLHLLRK